MAAKIVKVLFISILIGLIYNPLFAQWVDNFDDGDFMNNPTWVGDTNEFSIESGVLRLTALAQTGSSYVSTASGISTEASWHFSLTLDFNPSASNYAKLYLMADAQNLSNVQNGYFVKIGGLPDEISLYKIEGGNETLLIDGVDGRVSLSNVEIEIQVTRNVNNIWELSSKLIGEPNFVSEGNMIDGSITSSVYFGLFCKYTSTRSTKFYLDDIIVTGSTFVDDIAPELVGYSTPTNTQIILAFNEPIDTTQAKKGVHFMLNDPINATNVSAINSDTLLIEFDSPLSLINQLNIIALPDTIGNTLDTLLQVLFVDSSPFNYRDLVINEIFPDPNPQEDLPAFEFVELFNNSDRIIDLMGWLFTDGTKTAILSTYLFFPDSFLIICPIEAQGEYRQFGATLGLTNWPSLNNGGDNLRLFDSDSIVIDSVNYSLSWYQDNIKDNGGWSLEQINSTSKCLGAFNWAASTSEKGGTPGKQNTINSVVIDATPPIITHALLTKTSVEVWLSKPVADGIYQGTISAPNYQVSFEIPAPSTYLKGEIEESVPLNTYNIEVPLQDCNGNLTVENSILYNIYAPTTGNIIINEMLFNPYLGGADFVELYNSSERYFNLKNYVVSNETNEVLVADSTLLLKPWHYVAISENITFLKNEYLAPDSSLFDAKLPTLPNDEGMILLKSADGVIIDSVVYNEDYHFSLIDDVEGISLERISITESSTLPDNWRSASESTNYATPGYKNSQSRAPATEGAITVLPQVITPNNDGQADFCQISYLLDSQSQTVSISVYNLQGQLVKTIASNAIIAPSGFFTWDGTNQQGGILTTAHYIIVSEIITSNGRVLTFRNKVVVANGF